MHDIKKELNQHRYLTLEIERQQERLRKLRNKKKRMVADTVKGSMLQFPYTQQIKKIEGYDTQAEQELKKMIDQSIRRDAEEIVNIERIISTLPEARERELMRSKFIDCLSWDEVSQQCHISSSRAREIVSGCISRMSK